MNKTIEQLIENLDTIPFLFVGSGLSRRYYNLPDWIGLLKVMVDKLNKDSFAFRSYEDRASFESNPYGINPKIASLIEEDFNKEWFQNPAIRNLDEIYLEKVEKGCSPFKAEMSYYLKQKSVLHSNLKDEVTLLNNIAKKSIAGIITTNYDLFFETYLSEYKVYIGQQALLFSQLQGIAEVYKIHGSLNDPQSIVINEKDYKEFKEKREYLAAKLLTIFMEYPIIFMGYSISDSNIRDILSSIVKCMSNEQVKLLKEKFIFIEYDAEMEGYEIGESSFAFEDDKMITMTKITLSDYSLIYNAIGKKKMKIPVRLLRVLKDELYLFTLSNEPTKNIKVAPIDDDRVANDELVISIGTTETVNLNGLKGISTDQWYRNIVMQDLKYDTKDLLAYAPTLAKQVSGILPINSLYEDKFKDIEGIDKLLVNDFEDIISKTIERERRRHPQVDIQSILKEITDIDKQMLNIAYLKKEQINLINLENYLKSKFEQDSEILKSSKQSTRTNLRRLIRIYDYLKGENKKASN
ncbi:SIR2 family protein [Holdemanella porci]|uniref:SIR2 family protein n=1 Tax=Holdemanella porci TaxID=2652276 RepID=UPI002147268A|nr:SIR2 family protein [[Clostridium] innocuum]MCR0275974.1 SIR2 family protein [[Clostridium] innocuum]